MNVEIFSALSRNVGKLREMKKAHEDMATEIAVLRLENSKVRSKFLSPISSTFISDFPALHA